PDNEAKIELSVSDRDLREVASEKVKIPIEPPAQLVQQAGGVKVTTANAVLLDEPQSTGRAFGKLAHGTSLSRLARVGDYVKVDLGSSRFAFVAAKDVTDGGNGAQSPSFHDLYTPAPPTNAVAPRAAATGEGHIKIGATATDVTKLLDTYIFVGSRKVFYRSNGSGSDPRKMALDADVALRPGVNIITVFARESPDTV